MLSSFCLNVHALGYYPLTQKLGQGGKVLLNRFHLNGHT